MQKFENCFGKLEATAELIYMKSSHLPIIMGDFATLVQKDKFAQLSVRADNLHATSTIQNPVKEILWSLIENLTVLPAKNNAEETQAQGKARCSRCRFCQR